MSKALCGLPLMFALLAGGAHATEPANGERLARVWCASCHTIDSKAPAAASSSVPSFQWIARERPTEQQRAFLTSPHGGMPNFDLTRAEIEDLISYIREQR